MPLHPAPIILATKVMIHLRATWMHSESGAMELPEDLLPQIRRLGTTTRPLYRRLPSVWMAQPSSAVPDCIRVLIDTSSASCTWDSITLLSRDGVAIILPKVPYACSSYCSLNWPTVSSIRHSREAILANTPCDFWLSASATTFALPGW